MKMLVLTLVFIGSYCNAMDLVGYEEKLKGRLRGEIGSDAGLSLPIDNKGGSNLSRGSDTNPRSPLRNKVVVRGDIDALSEHLQRALAEGSPAASPVRSAGGVPANDKVARRLSVVYFPSDVVVPPLNLQDVESGHGGMTRNLNPMDPKTKESSEKSSEKITQEKFEKLVDAYATLSKTSVDQIRKDLVKKLLEIHDSPLNTPVANKDKESQEECTHDQKRCAAVRALAQASDAHTTITARGKQDINNLPETTRQAGVSVRTPTLAEFLEQHLGAEAEEALKALANIALDVANQKLGDSQATQKKTTWAGIAGAGATAAASILVTYLSTKKSC